MTGVALLVKICGLTHATSVQAAVLAGADALGFVFAPSIRRVTARQAAILGSRVPAHIRRVAVMQHPDPALWQEVQTIFCPDVLQTDAGDFDRLEVPKEIERWPVVREGEAFPAEAEGATFVYEGAVSGAGEAVDWRAAAAVARRGQMILAGGLDAENVAAAVATVRPFGVDVSSSVESAPGIKDPALIERFVVAARAAARDGGAGPPGERQ